MPASASNEEAEENANGHSVDAHGGGLEARAFAVHEKFGDILWLDRVPGSRRVSGFAPTGEGLQRALDEKLVTFGEAALSGEIHEELLDRSDEGGVRGALGVAHWTGV